MLFSGKAIGKSGKLVQLMSILLSPDKVIYICNAMK